MWKTGVLVFVLLVTVFTSESYSSPYILIDGGGGGASEAGSMGFGFGGTKAIRDKYPMELNISFGFTNDVPSDLLDYPVPHSDYHLLGDKNNGNEYGLLLKFGIPLGENINIMLGGGGSFQK